MVNNKKKGKDMQTDNPQTKKQPITDNPQTKKQPITDNPQTKKQPITDKPQTKKQPITDKPQTKKQPIYIYNNNRGFLLYEEEADRYGLVASSDEGDVEFYAIEDNPNLLNLVNNGDVEPRMTAEDSDSEYCGEVVIDYCYITSYLSGFRTSSYSWTSIDYAEICELDSYTEIEGDEQSSMLSDIRSMKRRSDINERIKRFLTEWKELENILKLKENIYADCYDTYELLDECSEVIGDALYSIDIDEDEDSIDIVEYWDSL